MRQADNIARPVTPARRAAAPVKGLKPVRLVPTEIAALCNTWPGKVGAAIIPYKLTKQEKRVLLPIGPDWELDVDPFRSQAAAPGGVAQFIHTNGGGETIPLPYRVGDRLYVDELVEVTERPEGEDWIQIRWPADGQGRIVFFEPGEVRPKLGLLKTKVLPVEFARGDRLAVMASTIDRLWSIDEVGAKREGAHAINNHMGDYFPDSHHRFGFEAIWNEAHPPFNSFSKANWWVQVLTLRREFDE